jgi:hypothetical protein
MLSFSEYYTLWNIVQWVYIMHSTFSFKTLTLEHCHKVRKTLISLHVKDCKAVQKGIILKPIVPPALDALYLLDKMICYLWQQDADRNDKPMSEHGVWDTVPGKLKRAIGCYAGDSIWSQPNNYVRHPALLYTDGSQKSMEAAAERLFKASL